MDIAPLCAIRNSREVREINVTYDRSIDWPSAEVRAMIVSDRRARAWRDGENREGSSVTICNSTARVEHRATRRRRSTVLAVTAALATALAALASPAAAAPSSARDGLAKPRPLTLQAGRSRGFVKSQIGTHGIAVTCSKRGVRLTFVVFSTTPKIKIHGNGPLLAVVPSAHAIKVTCS
jgi:hypothetical protein